MPGESKEAAVGDGMARMYTVGVGSDRGFKWFDQEVFI